MNYLELRDKTIFDFTDDEALISRITRHKSKDDYLYFYHRVNIMPDIVTFAQLTGNKELEQAASKMSKIIKKEWEDDIALQEKENPGLIVE